MKDQPNPREPSVETSPNLSPSTDPAASAAPASTAPATTLKQWEASQPHYPIQRVPRTVVAPMFKGSIFGPRSWIIERACKYVKPLYPWLSQQAKPTVGQNETEAS